MSDLLYYDDSYLREFTAHVADVQGAAMALDRTAFYPGGGGQPSDLGALSDGAQTWPVVKMRKEGALVWHEVEGAAPITGAAIHGALNWERRYKLMRTHTALHILCGVIWRDWGAQVTGGNMDPLEARMDFELEHMSADFAHEVEERVNTEIAAARAVRTRILPRVEAFRIPDLIRTKINLLPEGIQQVRVVEIVGLDLQADVGTHVANTREVGRIKVVDHKSKGKINKRLRIAIE